MEDFITAIIGLIGGGTAGAVVAGLFARKKVKAEAKKTEAETKMVKAETSREITQAWKDFAEKMEARQDELDKENEGIRKELKRTNRVLDQYGKRIIYLTNGIGELIEQIKKKGESPCWVPDEWQINKD